MLYLTRRERFSAAHKLWNNAWSEEENLDAFGKCANPNWHGHNYELFVTVKGKINPATGFVINLKALSAIIKDKILVHLDHKNVNLETPFMKDRIASTENIAVSIWEVLNDEVTVLGATLHCIKVVETENNYIEYYGES